MLMYLVYVRPFKNRMDNYKEIFNESCVLLSIPFLFGFAVFKEDGEKLIIFGWIFVAIMIMNVAVNVFYAFYYSVVEKLTDWLKKKGYCRGLENSTLKIRATALPFSESGLIDSHYSSTPFGKSKFHHDRNSSNGSDMSKNLQS